MFHKRKAPLWLGCCVSLAILAGVLPFRTVWIPSTCRHASHQNQRILTSIQRSPPILGAVKDSKDDSKSEEGTSSGFFGRFSSGESGKKKDDLSEKPKNAEESTGVLRSISKYFSSRETREAKIRAKKEEELAAILEKESRINGMSQYFPRFNTSSITSTFQNVSSGFSQARDEIRAVRPAKTSLTEEEKRIEELRRRAAADKTRRLAAQQVADQRAVDRRKRKEKEQEETRMAKEAEAKEKVSDEKLDKESEKGPNPLSVAQKYFKGLFDKQKDKEEWLVVAPKTRIAPGQMVPVTAAGLDLLLVASKDGSAVYCVENSCPHLGTPLEVGMLERRPIEAPSSSKTANTTMGDPSLFQETDIAKLLTQDGCEDCIVCPLHRTAFALESGEVRGEWCPYPPVIGKVMGTVKTKATLPVFDVRTKGKNIEVRINTPLKLMEDKE